MPQRQHSSLAIADGLHPAVSVLFADDASRVAYALSAQDIGRLAIVSATGELWLVSIGPAWTRLSADSGRVTVSRLADEPVGGGRVVVATSASGVSLANAGVLAHAHAALGVTAGAASSGTAVSVVTHGIVSDSGWSFIPGAPVFVGTAAGVLTQSPPSQPASAYSLSIGCAISPASLFVRPSTPIILT